MRTSFYPYPPRPGSNYETLGSLETPETPRLNEAELESVLSFEHQLYDAALDPAEYPRAGVYCHQQEAEGVAIEPLEIVWKKKINVTGLGVGYFLTDEGREAYTNLVGDELEAMSADEAKQKLAAIRTRDTDSKALSKIEAASIGFEERQLTQRFIDNEWSGDNLPTPEIVSVYKKPEVLLQKVRGYRQLKTYISRAIQDVKLSDADSSAVNDAKIQLAQAYRRRINGFLAAQYVEAYQFLHSHRLSGSTEHNDLIAEIESTLPAFSTQADDVRTVRFLQRMDRYRHGVSADADGNFTWLSPGARALAEQAEQPQEEVAVDRRIYEDIDLEALHNTTITPETFGTWLRDVLDEYELLSAYDEWDSEREEPAPDGQWQVIVDDKFKSLAVNDKQRVVKVPAKEVTLLFALSVGSHEITHVVQHDNKRRIANMAIMERIGLDNSSEQAESGGKWQERIARETVTGKKDQEISGTGYLKAMEIKDRGGSYGECVQAYYEDLRLCDPKQAPEKAAAQAVNRARRIFRSGGFEYAQDQAAVTNTRSLIYLEQQLIYESMSDEQRRLLFLGGVTVDSALQLAGSGIIDLDRIVIPKKMPWELMYPKIKVALEAALQIRKK
jgi:hypothetical protein